MISDDEVDPHISYWPSVSDLFMTLFIIAVALVGSVVLVFLPDPAEKVVVAKIIGPINQIRARLGTLPLVGDGASKADVATALEDTSTEAVRRLQAAHEWQEQAEAARGELARLNPELDASREQIGDLKMQVMMLELAKGMRLEDKPPIITIADADKRHFFASGSAAVTPEFKTDLGSGGFQEIAAQILKRNRDGRQTVDTLEIIGHTDGVPVAGRGNLDAVLPEVLDGDEWSFARLAPGSNNDLGLLRALGIKRAWHEFAAQHPERAQLKSIAVRTYSAGQTLPVEAGRYTAADARSRRIELRLTKLQ